MTEDADQHGHNVAWMTAQERDEYDRHLGSVWNNEGGYVADTQDPPRPTMPTRWEVREAVMVAMTREELGQ